MFLRAMVMDNGLARAARQGDGLLSARTPISMAADANSVIGAAQISGGLILRSGATAARTDTTDTAVALLAAMPFMDIGDCYEFTVSVQVAFAITLAGGTGVTASGNLVIAANGDNVFLLQKTGAATMNLIGL